MELFYLCTRLCLLNLVFLYGQRVFGNWVDKYKTGEVGLKWFSIFYRCLTFCMFKVGYKILICTLV